MLPVQQFEFLLPSAHTTDTRRRQSLNFAAVLFSAINALSNPLPLYLPRKLWMYWRVMRRLAFTDFHQAWDALSFWAHRFRHADTLDKQNKREQDGHIGFADGYIHASLHLLLTLKLR